jgi:hypothetical protein
MEVELKIYVASFLEIKYFTIFFPRHYYIHKNQRAHIAAKLCKVI